MHFDKDLRLIYLTEVTKKDILSGLSQATKVYGYCIEVEGSNGFSLYGTIIEVADQLEEFVGLGESMKKNLINTVMNGRKWAWTYKPAHANAIEITVSRNRQDVLGEVNDRLETLNRIRTDLTKG